MRGSSLAIALAFVLVLTGCAGGNSRAVSSSGVAEVMQEQMQKEDGGSTKQSHDFQGDTSSPYGKDQIDVDLTTMGADMVYATVNDMVTNSDTYTDKIIRMKGSFRHIEDIATGNHYFAVFIADAAACCSQGLEFVWGGGNHTWPDDYPEDGTEVIVEGRFEPYTEGSIKYVHLLDASLMAA